MSQITVLQEWSQARSALAASLSARSLGILVGRHRVLSGFRWRDDLIVTAAEPLGGCDQVTVVTEDAEHAAPVIASDPGTDVALLRLKHGASAAPGGAGPGALEVGAGVVFAGRIRRGPLVNFGSVRLAGPPWSSRWGTTIDQRLEFEGNPDTRLEGALVADFSGRVGAMLVAGPRGALLGIPISTIERVVASVQKHGYLPRPYLGLRLQPLWLDAPTRKRWGRHARSVPVVAAVEAESPAEVAGITPGDLLESIDGVVITDIEQILSRLRQAALGQMLTLGLRRGGLPQVARVEVADWRARAHQPLQSYATPP